MKATKKIIVLVFFITMSLSMSLFASDKGDSPDARLKAAKRYLQVAPMSKMVNDSILEMAQRVPPVKRAEFIKYMNVVMRVDFLEKVALEGMVKTFTTKELKALADFYGSEVGRSIMSKFGIYMAEVMPVLQQEIQRALQELQKEGKL